MTPMVRAALIGLRIYLILLLLVILYRFIRHTGPASGGGSSAAPAPASQKT